jgi:hypothetical protein
LEAIGPIRIHRSRSDVVDADSLFTKLLGGSATEMFDRGLGTGVRAVQSGESSKERSNDGDDFALRMRLNMERCFLDEEVCRLRVDGEPIVSGPCTAARNYISSYSFSVVSTMGFFRTLPTLLTAMLTFPNFATTSSNNFLTSTLELASYDTSKSGLPAGFVISA